MVKIRKYFVTIDRLDARYDHDTVATETIDFGTLKEAQEFFNEGMSKREYLNLKLSEREHTVFQTTLYAAWVDENGIEVGELDYLDEERYGYSEFKLSDYLIGVEKDLEVAFQFDEFDEWYLRSVKSITTHVGATFTNVVVNFKTEGYHVYITLPHGSITVSNGDGLFLTRKIGDSRVIKGLWAFCEHKIKDAI